MNLIELEEISNTVSGIADLLGALYEQGKAAGLSFKGMFMLYTQASDAAEKLEELVDAGYAKAKEVESKEI